MSLTWPFFRKSRSTTIKFTRKHTADLTGCKTVGDLVDQLRGYPHGPCSLFDDQGDIAYFITTENGSIPLNGSEYDPATPLPTQIDNTLNVTVWPRYFSVKIQRPVAINEVGHKTWRRDQAVSTRIDETIYDLKATCQIDMNIKADDLEIRFKGDIMCEDALLHECVISPGCDVVLIAKTSFMFSFKGTESYITFSPFEPLFDLLVEFAASEFEDLHNLHFHVAKSSGVPTGISKSWLPDRDEMFNATDVDGTVQDNGLLDGSVIQVYRHARGTKRKASCDLDEGSGSKIKKEG